MYYIILYFYNISQYYSLYILFSVYFILCILYILIKNYKKLNKIINTVKYEESVWMKIRSERGREALYIGCVYMPTDSTSISVMDSCYERLKEDVLSFREKGKVVLLGDFNARVGRSAQLDDVVGMFGENTCNCDIGGVRARGTFRQY